MLSAYGASGQTVRALKLPQLQAYLAEQAQSKTVVVNFWATWCKPCVHELPFFEAAQKDFASKGVKIVLVSVDFSDELESRLAPFVKSKGLECEVILLDESNPNEWIDKVNKDWSGSIPVTLIFDKKSGFTKFHAGEFTPDELKKYIDKAL